MTHSIGPWAYNRGLRAKGKSGCEQRILDEVKVNSGCAQLILEKVEVN